MQLTKRQALGIVAVPASRTGRARARWSMSRALALAALGLVVVALALPGGRPAPVNAQSGVIVRFYDHPNYQGILFSLSYGDITDFSNSRLDDTISSVWVERGVKVAVYSGPELTGTCEVFTASDPDLSNNRIGSNRITSVHESADCGAPVVRLFEHPNYGGASKVVGALNGLEASDLRLAGFNDTVTSIQVPAGQKVTVWADTNGGSRCETFTASDPDLRDNWIGDDSISSVRMDGGCYLTFFKDLNGGGQPMQVLRDLPDLRSLTDTGTDRSGFDDSVTSLQVPKGMMLAVYRDINYTGTCETFTASDRDLRDNRVGNDTISSVRVNRGC